MLTKEKITPFVHTVEDGMKLIGAGSFFMGAEGWGDFESPINEIFVDDFYIDDHPVTNNEFDLFIQETKYKTTAENMGYAMGYVNGLITKVDGLFWRKYFSESRKNHPVVLVSWEDAFQYAKWIGKRLPTEAEWEKAARGGLSKSLFPWGNNDPNHNLCNYGKETFDFPQTTEIKSFPPNAFGLYDMCGNVWNWCNDWFSETQYLANENNNPIGPKSGITKVRRGGSFNIVQTFRLRTSNRGAYEPKKYAINIGFRCVKDK